MASLPVKFSEVAQVRYPLQNTGVDVACMQQLWLEGWGGSLPTWVKGIMVISVVPGA